MSAEDDAVQADLVKTKADIAAEEAAEAATLAVMTADRDAQKALVAQREATLHALGYNPDGTPIVPVPPVADTRTVSAALGWDPTQAPNGGTVQLTAHGFTFDQVRHDAGTGGDVAWAGAGSGDGGGMDFLHPGGYGVAMHDAVKGDWVGSAAGHDLPITVVAPVAPPAGSGWHVKPAVRNAQGVVTTPARFVDPNGKVPKLINIGGPHEQGSAQGAVTPGYSASIKKWGHTGIRLNCNNWNTGVVTPNDNLDQIVQEMTGAGLYVILDMHGKPPSGAETSGTYLGTALTAMGDYLALLATTYKNNPLVGIGLTNEPGAENGGTVQSIWQTEYDYLIGRVRPIAPNMLLFLNGAQWAQDAGWNATVGQNQSALLSFGKTLNDKWTGLVFEPHIYDQMTSAGASTPKAKLIDYLTRCQALGLALFIGEVSDWNGSNAASFRPALDACYQVCPGMGIPIAPWHGQAQGDWYGLLTDSRDMGTVRLDASGKPTNATYQGGLHWTFCHGTL